MARPTIAFGTRELWPFVLGGGIGRVLHGAIGLLAGEAEVTVITRDAFRDDYERMRAAGDPRLPHPDVHFEFIADPQGFELGPFSSFPHCWSALMYERLCELFPGGGPDLVEFNDYMGEGFVTIQARRSGHPSMRNARVVVGLHTSLEMVDVLNSAEAPDEERRAIYTLERGSIAFADALVAPHQEALDGYARFYGADRIAPGVVVPHVMADPAPGTPPGITPPDGERTRLLFVGRLQRVKGVVELVEASQRLNRDDWELTLLGGDTDTAPGGGSMRQHLEQIAGGDKRVLFHDRVPVDGVLRLMDDHHVVVTPSLWECWSAVAREALSRNRPLLATPRGGLPEAVEAGVSGWLAEGTSADDIERALELVLDARGTIDAMIAAGAPAQKLEQLIQPEVTVARYRELLAEDRVQISRAAPETVSAVVICSTGSGSIGRTLTSISALEGAVDEVVLVCDGVERLPTDMDLAAVDALELLSGQEGVAACRNAGIESSNGAAVLLVDAGTELDRELLGHLVDALAVNHVAGYATSWARGLDPSAVPLGNFCNLVVEHDNAASTPLIRRRVFERGFRFDPALGDCAMRSFYAALAEQDSYGVVVPERLASRTPFSAPCTDVDVPDVRRASDALAWVAP